MCRDTRFLYYTADCPDYRRTSQRSRAADDVYMFHRPVSLYPLKSSAFLPEAPVQVGLLLGYKPMMVMAEPNQILAVRPCLLQSAIPVIRIDKQLLHLPHLAVFIHAHCQCFLVRHRDVYIYVMPLHPFTASITCGKDRIVTIDDQFRA